MQREVEVKRLGDGVFQWHGVWVVKGRDCVGGGGR